MCLFRSRLVLGSDTVQGITVRCIRSCACVQSFVSVSIDMTCVVWPSGAPDIKTSVSCMFPVQHLFDFNQQQTRGHWFEAHTQTTFLNPDHNFTSTSMTQPLLSPLIFDIVWTLLLSISSPKEQSLRPDWLTLGCNHDIPGTSLAQGKLMSGP